MSVRRTSIPTTSSATLTRNGIRQPQVANPSPVVSTTSRNTRFEASTPIGTPNCAKLPYTARCRGVACSVATSTAPPHSPPTPNACTSRRNTSRIGAATPIAA